jgi:glutamate decarboxylase
MGKSELELKFMVVKKIRKLNSLLNELNTDLHRAIRKEDNSFVSRTTLESTRYFPQKITVLRAVTINPLTTPEILKEIISEHQRLGMALYEKNFRQSLEEI